MPRRSPCGERGLKCQTCKQSRGRPRCRSPCGERGLKCLVDALPLPPRPSLPVRGAWIEISAPNAPAKLPTSLPVRGAWIEICHKYKRTNSYARRSPCGERGLKWACSPWAWHSSRRSPCGERGLKYLSALHFWAGCMRRSPCGERGLKWGWAGACALALAVAPRAGSVD